MSCVCVWWYLCIWWYMCVCVFSRQKLVVILSNANVRMREIRERKLLLLFLSASDVKCISPDVNVNPCAFYSWSALSRKKRLLIKTMCCLSLLVYHRSCYQIARLLLLIWSARISSACALCECVTLRSEQLLTRWCHCRWYSLYNSNSWASQSVMTMWGHPNSIGSVIRSKDGHVSWSDVTSGSGLRERERDREPVYWMHSRSGRLRKPSSK